MQYLALLYFASADFLISHFHIFPIILILDLLQTFADFLFCFFNDSQTKNLI